VLETHLIAAHRQRRSPLLGKGDGRLAPLRAGEGASAAGDRDIDGGPETEDVDHDDDVLIAAETADPVDAPLEPSIEAALVVVGHRASPTPANHPGKDGGWNDYPFIDQASSARIKNLPTGTTTTWVSELADLPRSLSQRPSLIKALEKGGRVNDDDPLVGA
jgi:hypothetical protein